MKSGNWHDILTLLSLVVVADRRVYKEEVDTFVTAVMQLNTAISPDILMTKGMALDWFVTHRDKTQALLIGPNSEKNINQLIRRTRDLPKKSAVLKAMLAIANSDSDYHAAEDNVIRSTAKGWKVALPRLS